MPKLPLSRRLPRTLPSWVVSVARTAILAAPMGVLIAPPAQASTLFRWVTEDGVVSYTDDARRIPDRYRETATSERRLGLSSYARFTPADPEATSTYAARLGERLERLRALNREIELEEKAVATASTQSRANVAVRTGGERNESTIELSIPEDTERPVVVEVERLLDIDSMSTRHVTVVRQGDRVLSVIDPRKRVEGPSSGNLQDLIDGRR